MIYLSFASIIVGSIWAGVYLVMNGHPWFAFLVIAIGASVSMKSKSKGEE